MTEAAQATFNMADRGYEVEVIENYQNALNCVICSLIINKATRGCERHVFCEACVKEYLTKRCIDEMLPNTNMIINHYI